MRRYTVALALLFCAFPALALNRPADPVVLTGAGIPTLQGIAPDNLVAFKFDQGWRQIPVQVDERAVINFTQVYNGNTTYGSLSRLDYTDAGTFTGADPDATLDADDEIVFMAKDAGQARGPHAAPPAGVLAGTAIQIAITDPVDSAVGYVYLFEQDGTLDPSAGKQYVDYTFSLTAGDYKTKYNLGAGPNPENSIIETDYYARRFIDRWKSDELRIFAGSATGVDILDRHKSMFAPGYCQRSEDTFSAGEGAFIINKNGPVRALRSYVGANSGPRTQRQHAFYAQREDITTFLRTHSIPAIMDLFDYSPAAAGMTYHNNIAPDGVTIDGVPDNVATGALLWELVRGGQGSLAMLHSPSTNADGLTQSSYYLDEVNSATTQCTGDAHAYGQSGHFLIGAPTQSGPSIPNTDPKNSPFYLLSLTRTIYYRAPDLSGEELLGLLNNFTQPLTTAVQASPFDENATVPNVVGMTQADALSALAVAGLVVGTVTEQFSATAVPGTVLAQSPGAGASVGYGNAVNLAVAKTITGGILINNDRSVTNSRLVSLALTWSAGVVRMRFSDDGKTWSAWEPLSATRAHTLPEGEGHKTVRVQYRDRDGNNSVAFNDFIRVDTIPPTGSILINNGAVSTKNRNVSLKLAWSDGNGSGVVRMRFSIDGKTWTAWEPLRATKGYTLPATLGHHTVRVTYRDAGGNISKTYNDYIRLDAP